MRLFLHSRRAQRSLHPLVLASLAVCNSCYAVHAAHLHRFHLHGFATLFFSQEDCPRNFSFHIKTGCISQPKLAASPVLSLTRTVPYRAACLRFSYYLAARNALWLCSTVPRVCLFPLRVMPGRAQRSIHNHARFLALPSCELLRCSAAIPPGSDAAPLSRMPAAQACRAFCMTGSQEALAPSYTCHARRPARYSFSGA